MTMSARSDFRYLFGEGFNEPRAWLDRFMEHVYRDDDFICVRDAAGRAVSGLLLSPYSTAFHGAAMPLGYISCVATVRDERGKGYMSRAMQLTLNSAAERGMGLAALIPADSLLFYTYSHYGMATVYYVDEQRYTSLHRFAMPDGFAAAVATYPLLERLERAAAEGVLHTAAQYAFITDDLAMDGGFVLAATRPEGDAAMAFVDVSGDEALVRYLPATSAEAAEAALALVRERVGERRIVVWDRPGDRRVSLRRRGMARIVNADMVLSSLASAYPQLDMVIRLRDPVIAANDGIYILREGECTRVQHTLRRIALDVSVDVATRILFSAPAIGDIFGLPSFRPMLPLMLD